MTGHRPVTYYRFIASHAFASSGLICSAKGPRRSAGLPVAAQAVMISLPVAAESV